MTLKKRNMSQDGERKIIEKEEFVILSENQIKLKKISKLNQSSLGEKNEEKKEVPPRLVIDIY